MEGREQKGRRLAGSGLRLPGHVFALEGDRERRGLDWGTEREAGFGYPAHERIVQTEAVESDVCQVGIGHGRVGYRKFRRIGLAITKKFRSNNPLHEELWLHSYTV